MLTTLAIANYRSLRDLVMPLGRLNVVTGANGSGKSNLYRALRLLADTAQGGVIGTLSREGGLPSTLWAGPEQFSRAVRRGQHPVEGLGHREPVNLRLGFASDEYSYAIDLGMPIPVPGSAFGLDPEIKREVIWHGPKLRPASICVDRIGSLLKIRDLQGETLLLYQHLRGWDSMLLQRAEPAQAPERMIVREQIRSWRF